MYICKQACSFTCSIQKNNSVNIDFSPHRCHGFILMCLYSLYHSRMWDSVQTSLQTHSWNVMVGILLISVNFSLISGHGNIGLWNADIILTVAVKLKQNHITLTRTEAECRQPLMLTMIAAYSFNICHFLILLLLGASQWEEEGKTSSFAVQLQMFYNVDIIT